VKIRPKQFRVRAGEKIDLGELKTRTKPAYTSKQHYETLLRNSTRDLSRAQSKLYASDKYALLLIFQAMDAAGKDSTIKHVMSGVNPQGCQVFSFKHPSAEDLDHDFLWRTNLCLPERGRIGIFNRSYYEEVLVVRVHPEILEAQRLPERPSDDEELWRARYRSIVEMENHLCRNGTRILKFFLHLSKEEQRKRFLERIDDPDKNWKFSPADVAERSFWKKYMKAYEACLSATSTKHAPWHIVPADDKQNAQLIVSTIILEVLSELGLEYPKADARRERELRQIRRRLLAEGGRD
jgi:PPK2 family polyphosphate:nucleotide phosphotransferase